MVDTNNNPLKQNGWFSESTVSITDDPRKYWTQEPFRPDDNRIEPMKKMSRKSNRELSLELSIRIIAQMVKLGSRNEDLEGNGPEIISTARLIEEYLNGEI